jgi:CubicO group peptidase (beta-lactamase class C family)
LGRYWLPFLVLPGAIQSIQAQAPDDPKLLAALVKAYNETSAKELLPYCAAGFRSQFPEAKLNVVLKQARNKFGALSGNPVELRKEGATHIYHGRGERQEVVLRVALDSAGHLNGLLFVPAFLDGLPRAPITRPELQQRLDAAVEHSLRVYQVPSISLALVKGERVVWAHAYGYQNVARSVPADTQTVYSTGSIFKVLVATAVMECVDEGKLDLDKPVNQYLKKLQIANPYEKEAPLTARELLSHHGGIPNAARFVPLWSRERPITLEELVRQRVHVTSRPGKEYQYSNLAYAMNGYLLAELSGKSFEQAMQERLFGPLGMTHTTLAPTPAMQENLAIPYSASADGKGVVAVDRILLDEYPAGDLYSTPSDLARFLILHLNAGKYEGKQILSARSAAEMARLQFAPKDAQTGQGLGWMVGKFQTRRILWHNGAVPGFYSYLAIDPEKRVGAVLFCNRFTGLEMALGLFVDPVADLAHLAVELLDRLAER